MFSDTFKVINNIRNELCDIAAQGAHYKNWSDEFARKEIREVIFNEAAPLRKKRDTIILDANLQNMTALELHEAGFREWSVKYPGLFLIPLWLVGYMDHYMPVTDVFGRASALGDIDNETRGGVIAAGFIHKVTADAITAASNG